MTGWDKGIISAARRPFMPPNPTRIVRSTLVFVGTTIVLGFAAYELAGWLSWLLWAGVAHRVLAVISLPVASAATDERQARVDSLPPGCVAVLRTDKRVRP